MSLRHPFSQTSVTESWQPNFELCEKKLAPLGITVRKTEEDKPLPFADNMDLKDFITPLVPYGGSKFQSVGRRYNRDVKVEKFRSPLILLKRKYIAPKVFPIQC